MNFYFAQIGYYFQTFYTYCNISIIRQYVFFFHFSEKIQIHKIDSYRSGYLQPTQDVTQSMSTHDNLMGNDQKYLRTKKTNSSKNDNQKRINQINQEDVMKTRSGGRIKTKKAISKGKNISSSSRSRGKSNQTQAGNSKRKKKTTTTTTKSKSPVPTSLANPMQTQQAMQKIKQIRRHDKELAYLRRIDVDELQLQLWYNRRKQDFLNYLYYDGSIKRYYNNERAKKVTYQQILKYQQAGQQMYLNQKKMRKQKLQYIQDYQPKTLQHQHLLSSNQAKQFFSIFTAANYELYQSVLYLQKCLKHYQFRLNIKAQGGYQQDRLILYRRFVKCFLQKRTANIGVFRQYLKCDFQQSRMKTILKNMIRNVYRQAQRYVRVKCYHPRYLAHDDVALLQTPLLHAEQVFGMRLAETFFKLIKALYQIQQVYDLTHEQIIDFYHAGKSKILQRKRQLQKRAIQKSRYVGYCYYSYILPLQQPKIKIYQNGIYNIQHVFEKQRTAELSGRKLWTPQFQYQFLKMFVKYQKMNQITQILKQRYKHYRQYRKEFYFVKIHPNFQRAMRKVFAFLQQEFITYCEINKKDMITYSQKKFLMMNGEQRTQILTPKQENTDIQLLMCDYYIHNRYTEHDLIHNRENYCVIYLLYTIEMIHQHLMRRRNRRRNLLPEREYEQWDMFPYKMIRPRIHLNSIRRQMDSIDRVIMREKQERSIEEKYAMRITQQLNYATELMRRKQERMEMGFDGLSIGSMIKGDNNNNNFNPQIDTNTEDYEYEYEYTCMCNRNCDCEKQPTNGQNENVNTPNDNESLNECNKQCMSDCSCPEVIEQQQSYTLPQNDHNKDNIVQYQEYSLDSSNLDQIYIYNPNESFPLSADVEMNRLRQLLNEYQNIYKDQFVNNNRVGDRVQRANKQNDMNDGSRSECNNNNDGLSSIYQEDELEFEDIDSNYLEIDMDVDAQNIHHHHQQQQQQHLIQQPQCEQYASFQPNCSIQQLQQIDLNTKNQTNSKKQVYYQVPDDDTEQIRQLKLQQAVDVDQNYETLLKKHQQSHTMKQPIHSIYPHLLNPFKPTYPNTFSTTQTNTNFNNLNNLKNINFNPSSSQIIKAQSHQPIYEEDMYNTKQTFQSKETSEGRHKYRPFFIQMSTSVKFRQDQLQQEKEKKLLDALNIQNQGQTSIYTTELFQKLKDTPLGKKIMQQYIVANQKVYRLEKYMHRLPEYHQKLIFKQFYQRQKWSTEHINSVSLKQKQLGLKRPVRRGIMKSLYSTTKPFNNNRYDDSKKFIDRDDNVNRWVVEELDSVDKRFAPVEPVQRVYARELSDDDEEFSEVELDEMGNGGEEYYDDDHVLEERDEYYSRCETSQHDAGNNSNQQNIVTANNKHPRSHYSIKSEHSSHSQTNTNHQGNQQPYTSFYSRNQLLSNYKKPLEEYQRRLSEAKQRKIQQYKNEINQKGGKTQYKRNLSHMLGKSSQVVGYLPIEIREEQNSLSDRDYNDDLKKQRSLKDELKFKYYNDKVEFKLNKAEDQ